MSSLRTTEGMKKYHFRISWLVLMAKGRKGGKKESLDCREWKGLLSFLFYSKACAFTMEVLSESASRGKMEMLARKRKWTVYIKSTYTKIYINRAAKNHFVPTISYVSSTARIVESQLTGRRMVVIIMKSTVGNLNSRRHTLLLGFRGKRVDI